MVQVHALIIDDNVKNINVLANMLSDENLTHARATNSKQLETLLQDIGPIGIVFLDLEMPDMTGYDVLKLLKSDTRFEGVPIVACTVHTNEIRLARQQGFNGFLGKPLDPDKFPDQIARILRGEQVWEAT